MKHTCSKCGHEDEINPAKLLASIRTPKKEAAWKANGERLRKMYANAKKLSVASQSSPIVTAPSVPEGYSWSTIVADDTPIAPRPPTLEGKKAAALAALGRVQLKRDIEASGHFDSPSLHSTPCAPFDMPHEEGTMRVTQMGKRLGLFFISGGEPTFTRYLAEGELEKFWEMRLK